MVITPVSTQTGNKIPKKSYKVTKQLIFQTRHRPEAFHPLGKFHFGIMKQGRIYIQ